MLNLYTEVAFHAAPTTAASIHEIQIPRHDGSYDKSKYSVRSHDSHTRNEQDYSQHHLATASDIYFRQHELAPRCILSRVVGQDKTLELIPTDISKSENDTTEACLALRLAFQDPILPSCAVAIDDKKTKEIEYFVCTSRNEIYHLRIPPDAFRRRDGLSEDVAQWCGAISLSSLSIETVYRIHAHSPYELFVSFTSGMVQRIRRKAQSKTWTPENYDDRTWGASIRGFVGRGGQRMIEYGSTALDARAAQRMVASNDGNYLYTLCLNHQLRIWHLASGRLVVSQDLLNINRETRGKVQLNPAERGQMQLIKRSHMKNSILITFSPHEGGQFKFWDVKETPLEGMAVEDRYPGIKLTPPDPDPTGNTVWSVVGFDMHSNGVRGSSEHEIMDVLWRNDNHHQLYSLHFEFNDLERAWEKNWNACAPTASKKSLAPTLSRSNAEDISGQWLDFLMWPGRYSVDTIETALSIFLEASTKTAAFSQGDSLRARLATTIAADVVLRKYENSVMDYDRFATDTDHQWKNFWRIVESLNEARNAPLAFAYDTYTSELWVIMADKCCAIRECDDGELIGLNEAAGMDMLQEICSERWAHRQLRLTSRGMSFEKMASIAKASHNFRAAFPVDLAQDLEVSVEEVMSSNPERTTSSVVYEIYDAVNFSDSISNDVYDRCEKDLESFGGLELLNNDAVLGLIHPTGGAVKRPKSHLRSTMIGSRLLSAGLLDYMLFTRELLWDLLVLVIFVEGELNQDDEKLANFDAAELFSIITPELKTLDRNIWLATHSRSLSMDLESPKQSRQRTEAHPSDEHRTISILESTLWSAIRPQPVTDQPQTYELLRAIQEISDWSASREDVGFDNGTVYLLCDLLRHDELDCATEFLKFLPFTAWSTYAKARLYLAKSLFDSAAVYFRQCSFTLTHGKAIGELTTLSCGLLTAHEANAFYNGLPLYFHHILTLFESVSAYSQVALYAHLALQSLTPNTKEPSPGFKQDTLSRLFTAQIRTSQFPLALSTLTQFTDTALQRSSCTSLINAIIDLASNLTPSSSVELLQSLSWPLHPHLSRHLDTHLTTLAKHQTSLPTQSNPFANQATAPDYLSILYALRISQTNYRGAVSVLYDRLRLIQRSGKARSDPKATALRHALLGLINAMSCMGKEERWIVVDVGDHRDTRRALGGGVDGFRVEEGEAEEERSRKRRRVIVTLADLRREYQATLDRCARVERGDFEFDDYDAEEEEEEEEGRMEVDGVSGESRLG